MTTQTMILGNFEVTHKANTVYVGSTSTTLLDSSGNILHTGYLRVGSISAPVNTTAGDLTAVRLSVGNTALGATSGYIANISGTVTDTASGAKIGLASALVTDPAGASASEFRAFVMQTSTPSGNAQNFSQIREGIFVFNQLDGSGNHTGTAFGGVMGLLAMGVSSSAATAGTITEASGVVGIGAQLSGSSTKTITTARGLYAPAPSAMVGTVTTYIGLEIDAITVGGTNYGIKNGSSLYQIGNVGFYGTTPQAKPTVTGSRGANAALASLLTALAGLGLLTDSSTV